MTFFSRNGSGQSGGHPSFEAIVGGIKALPGMIEHLEGIDLDGDGLPDHISPMGFMDPVSSMRWQGALAEHKRRDQARQARRAQRKEANNQTLLAHLRAQDPLFEAVHWKVGEFVRSLPAKLQRPFLLAVEQTPGAYLDLYKEMRGLIGLALRHGGTNRDGGRRSGRAVAERLSAPNLESAGTMDDRLPVASRSAELAELKARCRAGKAREGDLLRYLELNWRG